MTSTENNWLTARDRILWYEPMPSPGTQQVQDIVDKLNKLQDELQQDSAIVLVIRHGEAGNNKSQADYGHQFTDQYLAHGDHLQDPQLESMGKENAKKTGAWLHDILIQALKVNVDNIAFHTSSLERCISTAELVMQEMGCKGEPLYVHDGLREWVGYDHQSNTDKRNPKTQIEGRHKATKLRYLESFPEDDELFVEVGGKVKELWVDVGIRWVTSLVSAFTRKRTLKYIILVSNNRAIQCGLRELGLKVDEEKMASSKLPEKLVVQDMKNAGVMALVVNQINFDKKQCFANWNALRVQDKASILTLRKKETAVADEQAGKLSEKQYEEVKKHLSGPRPDDWRHIQEVWLKNKKSQK